MVPEKLTYGGGACNKWSVHGLFRNRTEYYSVMPLIFFVFWFFCIISSKGFCQDFSAMQLYKEGKYQQAYDSLQEQGLKSPAQFYNAANCLFRLGKPGQALAYYLKANEASPNNENIEYNLSLVKESLIAAGVLPLNASFWSGKLIPFAKSFAWSWYEIIFAFITSLLAAVLIYSSKHFKQPSLQVLALPQVYTAVFLWITVVLLLATGAVAKNTKLASVVSDVSIARSGPHEKFTELFQLPAGSLVEYQDEIQDNWRQIRFSLGKVGWVMEKDLLPL